jgi:pimeloyl-ACP methyl ester carboxylesterase
MTNQITEQRIKLSNITLNVATGGDKKGEPILLLHGYPDAWFGWKPVMAQLIQKGFRVIAPDQRGYNLSDKPVERTAYHSENIVQDAIDLMAYFGYERFSLAGHDFGGYIAWQIALTHEKRIHKLIILSCFHPKVIQNIAKLNWRQWLKSWYLIFFKLSKLPELFIRFNNFHFLRHNISQHLSEEEKQQYIQSWQQPNFVESTINWYRAPINVIKRPQLSLPVLIIWGKNDAYLGLEGARKSLKFCENGELKIIENASHWLMQENTKRVTEMMTDFLSSSSLLN